MARSLHVHVANTTRAFRATVENSINGEDLMDTQLDYEINKELGECYLFMGDFDKAEEYYRKAAGNNTKCAAPYMGLATVAVQRSELDKALVLYEKAAAVEETDKALCGIGLVYMEQGRHEKAFDLFSRALDIAPENMVALNCLVREAYQIGSVTKTLRHLEAALETGVETEAVRVTLAGCLIYLGHGDEARTHLETVLGANPANSSAKELFETMAA
jgi:tetratricopeptide (TPR) repeat protein